jgi:NAD(P)-dependent dehydrogenase (short-subunit alcohol dehydrogenase family)
MENNASVEKDLAPSPGLLAGEVALISGGSSGIGLATALRFAQEGARVAILARGEEQLEAAAERIERETGCEPVLALSADITNEQTIVDAYRAVIERFGRLDIMVSSAGSIEWAPAEDTPVALFRRMLEVHCIGYYLMAREAIRAFIQQGDGGRIVFIVSDNAVKPSHDLLAYNVAKAGELHMARCIADECGKYNIRINSILPGAVFGDSAFWTEECRASRAKSHGFDPSDLEEEYKKNAALGVIILPEEVAELALFLASDQSAKITGAAISIDGGGRTGYLR